MENETLVLGTMLAIKHFIFDGPLQTPYQYLNKGKFLHPGGLIHSALHGLGTLLALCLVDGPYWLAAVDCGIHYFTDFLKVKFTKSAWAHRTEAALVVTHNNYFNALMLDQCVHFQTYVVILWAAS